MLELERKVREAWARVKQKARPFYDDKSAKRFLDIFDSDGLAVRTCLSVGAEGYSDRMLGWIGWRDPHADRAAVGFEVIGDDPTVDEFVAVFTEIVDNFNRDCEHFAEGDRLPDPKYKIVGGASVAAPSALNPLPDPLMAFDPTIELAQTIQRSIASLENGTAHTRGVRHRVLGKNGAFYSIVITKGAYPPEYSPLENALVGLLAEHCGETGQNEGAVDTLKRIIEDHKGLARFAQSTSVTARENRCAQLEREQNTAAHQEGCETLTSASSNRGSYSIAISRVRPSLSDSAIARGPISVQEAERKYAGKYIVCDNPAHPPLPALFVYGISLIPDEDMKRTKLPCGCGFTREWLQTALNRVSPEPTKTAVETEAEILSKEPGPTEIQRDTLKLTLPNCVCGLPLHAETSAVPSAHVIAYCDKGHRAHFVVSNGTQHPEADYSAASAEILSKEPTQPQIPARYLGKVISCGAGHLIPARDVYEALATEQTFYRFTGCECRLSRTTLERKLASL